MCRYPKKKNTLMVQRYNMYKRNTNQGRYYATIIKHVVKAVLNDARVGESLTCSGKPFHNEDAAESNDPSPQDLLVLILLKRCWLLDLISAAYILLVSGHNFDLDNKINKKHFWSLPQTYLIFMFVTLHSIIYHESHNMQVMIFFL